MKLVEISGNEPVTTSLIVAKGIKKAHHSVIIMIDKYQKDLKDFGTLEFKIRKSGGRPLRYAVLNEGQTTFLITLMRNNERVIKFKKELTKEFFKQRQLISTLLTQRQNKEWQEQRELGKVSRRLETDVIQQFIKYCEDRGSKHAQHYYSNISKMENKALFLLEQKYPNVREVLSGYQLNIIASADIIVAKALKEGMEQEMSYKDIYAVAKDRIDQFAKIIGKTLVPMQSLENKNDKSITMAL